jgi:hypothetical protein
MLFNLFVILGVIFFWLCVVGFAIIIIYLLYAFFILPILSIFSKKWEKKYRDFFNGGCGTFPPFGL